MKSGGLVVLAVCACVIVIAGITWMRHHDQSADGGERARVVPPGETHPDLRVQSDAPPAPAPMLADSTPSGFPSQQEMQALARKEMQKHETAWNLATPSSAWSQAAEEQLSEIVKSPALDGLLFKPQQVSARCKATVCRVEAAFPPGASASEWNTRLLLGMGDTFGASSTIPMPGKDSQTVYVTYAYHR